MKESGMTFDLDLWPTDLKINRDHLLTKDYLPTKFEASGAKRYWVISCTRLRATDIPTDTCKAICPPFSKGGINMHLNGRPLVERMWYPYLGIEPCATAYKSIQTNFQVKFCNAALVYMNLTLLNMRENWTTSRIFQYKVIYHSYTYCNRSHFRMGVIFFFFHKNFLKTELNPFDFIREMGVLSGKLPNMTGLANFYAKFSPTEKYQYIGWSQKQTKPCKHTLLCLPLNYLVDLTLWSTGTLRHSHILTQLPDTYQYIG